jgi:hypothetical protein
MDNEKKSAYIAGGIFLIVGILFLFSTIDSAFSLKNPSFILGSIMILLGIGGIWKPKIVGQILDKYLNDRFNQNSKSKSISQSQTNSEGNFQINTGDNSKVKIIYPLGLSKEKLSDKKELIKEIRKDLSEDKLSNVLIKCMNLASIIDSKKDIIWINIESKGYESENKIKKEDIPIYRVINSEIRLQTSSGIRSFTYKINLGAPIYEIEDWIKNSKEQEILLSAPPTEQFKTVFEEYLGELKDKTIPYIIRVSELKKILNGLKIRISEFISSIK